MSDSDPSQRNMPAAPMALPSQTGSTRIGAGNTLGVTPGCNMGLVFDCGPDGQASFVATRVEPPSWASRMHIRHPSQTGRYFQQLMPPTPATGERAHTACSARQAATSSGKRMRAPNARSAPRHRWITRWPGHGQRLLPPCCRSSCFGGGGMPLLQRGQVGESAVGLKRWGHRRLTPRGARWYETHGLRCGDPASSRSATPRAAAINLGHMRWGERLWCPQGLRQSATPPGPGGGDPRRCGSLMSCDACGGRAAAASIWRPYRRRVPAAVLPWSGALASAPEVAHPATTPIGCHDNMACGATACMACDNCMACGEAMAVAT